MTKQQAEWFKSFTHALSMISNCVNGLDQNGF